MPGPIIFSEGVATMSTVLVSFFIYETGDK